MKVIKLNCTACGAPINIPENVDQLNCANCGTHLFLERGEGYYALKAADQITSAIKQSGQGTQDAIREGAQVTAKELKRLQLTQSLGNANNALNATMAEQRTLTRGQMTPRTLKQRHALNFQEWTQYEEVRQIQMQIDVLNGGPIEENELGLKRQITMLEHAIRVLKTCPPSPKNDRSLQNLSEQKKHFQSCLREQQIKKFKSQFQSFEIKKPFSQDLNVLLKQCRLVQKELSRLAQEQQTPITIQTQQQLQELFTQLDQHWHQEVYRQCWQDLNPKSDPENTPEEIDRHLSATQATIQWLSASPAPSKKVTREIRKLKRRAGKLQKSHQTLLENQRFQNGLKQLRNSLTAFNIIAPFSSNLSEVRGQMHIFQKDLHTLKNRPPAPETRQAQKELNQRYQALYQHWTQMERNDLQNHLTASDVHPPFNTDFDQARSDYDRITADIAYLKANPTRPGAEETLKKWIYVQRQLYSHLNKLRENATNTNQTSNSENN